MSSIHPNEETRRSTNGVHGSAESWIAQASVPGIYLARQDREPGRGILGGLAHRFGLDVYGSEGLSDRARIEMRFAALLLLFVFFFELGAWFLLFNMIVHAGAYTLSWASSFAFVGATLFATVIWLYERQFVTSDFSGPILSMLTAVGVRLAIIIGGALVTAQPLELLIFNGPISRRVHEESVQTEIVARYNELETAESRSKVDHERLARIVQSTSIARRGEELSKERKAAQRRKAELIVRIASARTKENSWKRRRRTRRRELAVANEGLRVLLDEPRSTAAERRRAQAKVAVLRNKVKGLDNRIAVSVRNRRQDEISLAEAKEELKVLMAARDRNSERLSVREKEVFDEERQDASIAESRARRLRNWIAQIMTGLPGQLQIERLSPELEAAGTSPMEFEDAAYDFFARHRVLQDLRYGRTARWPDGSERLLPEVEKVLRIPVTESPKMTAARRERASFFNQVYYLVFIISSVVPLMAIAFKLAMSADLKDYYSSRHQASIGNPEALLKGPRKVTHECRRV